MWKEVVMASFEVPSWYLPEGTEFATRYVSDDSQSPGVNPASCDKDTGKLNN